MSSIFLSATPGNPVNVGAASQPREIGISVQGLLFHWTSHEINVALGFIPNNQTIPHKIVIQAALLFHRAGNLKLTCTEELLRIIQRRAKL